MAVAAPDRGPDGDISGVLALSRDAMLLNRDLLVGVDVCSVLCARVRLGRSACSGFVALAGADGLANSDKSFSAWFAAGVDGAWACDCNVGFSG